jgi:hypothetical protein
MDLVGVKIRVNTNHAVHSQVPTRMREAAQSVDESFSDKLREYETKSDLVAASHTLLEQFCQDLSPRAGAGHKLALILGKMCLLHALEQSKRFECEGRPQHIVGAPASIEKALNFEKSQEESERIQALSSYCAVGAPQVDYYWFSSQHRHGK